MTRSLSSMLLALGILAVIGAATPGLAQASEPLVVFGGMHQALGKGEVQARVDLAALLDRKHFYAVGALAGLAGEITILDSVAYATGVTPAGRLDPRDGSKAAATLLVGRSVPRWASAAIDSAVSPDRFDDAIGELASAQGVDLTSPFMFVIEGGLTDVRLHVINGACPVHARNNKLELRADKTPFELEVGSIQGTVVGVYAADAVGKLTHPATSTHAHLVFRDEETGEQVTGHLERVGVAAGAVLKVPADSTAGRTPDHPEDGR